MWEAGSESHGHTVRSQTSCTFKKRSWRPCVRRRTRRDPITSPTPTQSSHSNCALMGRRQSLIHLVWNLLFLSATAAATMVLGRDVQSGQHRTVQLVRSHTMGKAREVSCRATEDRHRQTSMLQLAPLMTSPD